MNILQILKKILSEIHKSAITTYKSTTQTLTTSAAKVVMGTQLGKRGDAFTHSNGGVLVNKPCFVEISGGMYVQGGLTSGDVIYVQIWVNDLNVGTAVLNKVTTNTGYFAISPVIREVDAGDYIYLYAYNLTGARGTVSAILGTRLTVKEI